MFETKLDAVKAAATKNFRVFPLNAKRQPAIVGWPERATSDIEQLETYWRKHPRSNVGIATGWNPIENRYLIVIDIDIGEHKDGFDSLAKFEMFNDKLPETYTTRTRSGGLHLYFWSDKAIGNSVSKLGNGIDVRCVRGFVVAPGSVDTEGRHYTIEREAPIATLPEWCAELCDAYREREPSIAPSIELDNPHDITRAIDYLTNDAPEAVEGASGNITSFTVANQLKDFGLSESVALEAMSEHWNPTKAIPSWDEEDLERIVANAYRYGQNEAGVSSPQADFEPFDQSQPFSDGSPVKGFQIPSVTPFEPRSLPRRRWILPKIALRGKVTVVIAPPGAGKSTLTIALALSVATDKPFMGIPVAERVRVAMYQNEDDMDELHRRLAAAMQHHNIGFPDLLGSDHMPMLYMESGENRPFTLAVKQGDVLKPQDLIPLIRWLKANDIGMLVIDPFAETHEANENDNGEILKIARWFRQIAQQANIAVVLIHHTKKPQGAASDTYHGDMNSGRGAGSLMGVARVALTLYQMSKKDAKEYQIPEDERKLYVRLDNAKENLSLSSANPTWFRRISVPLQTTDTEGAKDTFADTDGIPYAVEEVGTLEPVRLEQVQAVDELNDDILNAIENAFQGKEKLTNKELLAILHDDNSISHLDNRAIAYRVNTLLRDESVRSSLMLELEEITTSTGRILKTFYAM